MISTQKTGALTLRITTLERPGHNPDTGDGRTRLVTLEATGVGWFSVELQDQITKAMLWATDVDVCTVDGQWVSYDFGPRLSLFRDFPPGLSITTWSGDRRSPHRPKEPGGTEPVRDRL